MFRHLTLPGLLLAGTLAFLAAPQTNLAAAECGGAGDVLCKQNESCAYFVFFRVCTTTYDYWQSGERGIIH